MAEYRTNDRAERFSIRKSIGIWITGAVFSWVVVVVSLYNVIRFQDKSSPPASLAQDRAERLNDLAPAAGDDHRDTVPPSENERHKPSSPQ